MNVVPLIADPVAHFDNVALKEFRPHTQSSSSSSGSSHNKSRYAHNGKRPKILSLGWNLSGSSLACGAEDSILRVLDVVSFGARNTVTELKGHTACVEQLEWNPTHEDQLVTTSDDGTTRIWDTRAGKSVQSFKTSSSTNINVTWSPNGKYIANGDKRDVISILDVDAGKIMHDHSFNKDYHVNELQFNETSDYLLLSTGPGPIDICKFSSWEIVHRIEGHTAQCYCVKFCPNFKYLASGGGDAVVCIWDADNLVCLRTINQNESCIRSVSFSHTSQFVASGSEDKLIDISEVDTGNQAHTLRTRAGMNSVAWSPTAPLLAFSGDEKDGGYDHFDGTVSIFGMAKSSVSDRSSSGRTFRSNSNSRGRT